jgi:hypothetical protein
VEIITLKEAREQKLTYYYTGVLCKQGHVCKRIVSSRACYDCTLGRHKSWQEDNRSKISDYNKNYRFDNPVDLIENRKKTRERNKINPQPNRDRANKWARDNPARVNACPKWVDIGKLMEVYKACPTGYHVDHILPLQGRLITGIHVPSNLQYLTPIDNSIKHNKFEPYYQPPDGIITPCSIL